MTRQCNSDSEWLQIQTVETITIDYPKKPQEVHNWEDTIISLKSWLFKCKRNDVAKGSDSEFILFAPMKDLVLTEW